MTEKKTLSWEEKYKLLKALHASHVSATEKLEEKYHALVETSIKQQKLLENAQKAVDINKNIMIDSLTKHNEDMHHAGDRVRELKFAKMQAPR